MSRLQTICTIFNYIEEQQEQEIDNLKAEIVGLKETLAAREHSHRMLVDEFLPKGLPELTESERQACRGMAF